MSNLAIKCYNKALQQRQKRVSIDTRRDVQVLGISSPGQVLWRLRKCFAEVMSNSNHRTRANCKKKNPKKLSNLQINKFSEC